MKAVVDSQALEELIGDYVENFNDCACCPCYPVDCDSDYENRSECVDRIFVNYLKGKLIKGE